jgi:glycosyltransferase involved in cell wall biosynthesis
MSGLVVDLERPLPRALPVGSATAVFCLGTCFAPDDELRDLRVVVDSVRHGPAAFGMPRPDRPRLRSGFWATLPLPARTAPGSIELELWARLASGREVGAPLGRIEVVERVPPPPVAAEPERPGPAPPLIAICMATFEPNPALLRAQVESLREQRDDRWICLVSDDGSSPDHVASIREIIGDDPRFALSCSRRRQGFYRNFERALGLAPDGAELFALCDQDDRWHPDKLATLRAALGEAQLVYSDQRLVDAGGRVLRETLWRGRRNNATNLASMLIANTITGAATLFRRDVVELALPFPDSPGFQFHDHWLAVVALAAGDVHYVDRPLYDYVQHPGAILGQVTSAENGRRAWRPATPRRAFAAARAAYFYGYLSREVQAQAALVRCSGRLTARKRRALRRFVASARSPLAFAWLALRPLRELAGRNETLGSEAALARGVAWRALVATWARHGPAPARLACDARFPPPGSFEQRRLRRWRARVW